MDYIKVVALIRKIPQKDQITLALFLNDGCKKETKLLYDSILSRLNNGLDVTNVSLWKDVFTNRPLNLNVFRKLCLDLLRNIEKYLSFLRLTTENTDFSLLQYYAHHRIDKFYEEKWEKLQAYSFPHLDIETVYQHYQLQLTHYNYLMHHPSKANLNHIATTDQTLDTYYFLQKIKLICHTLNEAKFTNFDYRIQHDDIIIQIIQQSSLREHPIIHIYLHIYALLNETFIDENLTKTKEILHNLNAVSIQEQKNIYQYFINYCIIQINKGDTTFEQELLDIFISYNQNIPDLLISPFRFKNIVTLSLKLKRYSFTEAFIQEYGEKLPEEVRATTIAFNKAKLCYETGAYDLAIQTLLDTVNDDLTYNLSAKLLIAKTFYEKKEFNFLLSFLESFRIFVLRNKAMNTISKKNYHMFIRICVKLIALQDKTETDIYAFQSNIIALSNLPDKAWVAEKIQELMLTKKKA